MMDHKIIIIEGQDRLGKSTCIKTLIMHLEGRGYDVVTMYGDHSTSIQEQGPDRREYFGQLYRTNPEAYNFGGASFEALSYSIRNLFSIAKRPTVMLFDRLTLSNIAYGMVIRPTRFAKFFNGLENYIELMNSFEMYIQEIAKTYLLTFVTDETFPNVSDDTNPFITISGIEIDSTAPWFTLAHSKSKVKQKLLEFVESNDAGYFNTMQLFSESFKEFFELEEHSND